MAFTVSMNQPYNVPSIRRTLTRRLALALTVIGLVGATAASLLGNRYANLAYDRALFDDVITLANQIEIREGELHVNLPQAAQAWLTADQGEVVRYRIIDLNHERVLDSNGSLGEWDKKIKVEGQPYFRDAKLDDKDFRVAYMRRSVDPYDWPVLIEVGESRGKRTEMSEQIVAAAVLLVGIMFGVAVWLVRQGVKSALAPLSQLEADAAERSSANLTPLDPLLAPQEVRGLIGSINQMMQRVSDAIESQNRFIANAAHQLRTPIAGLRLQAQIALKARSGTDVNAAIHEIEDSAARTAHLIEQLLVLSKAEVNAVMTRQGVDLTQIAQQVIERFLPQALRHQVDLGYEGAMEPVVVSGNEVLLTELLGNLVDNAIRYGHNEGKSGRVTVATAADADEVRLSVSDDGPGFGTSAQDKLFQRFYRPDSADTLNHNGAGLGLAIVKEIAERHGARISIGSMSNPQHKSQGCHITIHFKPAQN